MADEKIGLALGSGAARGWAHIGVIRALDEAGIRVDMVAGTSMGALVGAVFAAGGMDDVEQVALEMDWKAVIGLIDPSFSRSGLVDGRKVEGFVRRFIKSVRIEDLDIPFAAVATDLYGASEVVFDRGDLFEAVRASMSIPGIFTPVEDGGRYLVDGGLVNPVPVSVVRRMGAEKVIAVDLNYTLMEKARARVGKKSLSSPAPSGRGRQSPEWLERMRAALNEHAAKVHPSLAREIKIGSRRDTAPTIFEVIATSMAVTENRITELNLMSAKPDLLIRPILTDLNFLEFNRAGEAIKAGYDAARVELENWV